MADFNLGTARGTIELDYNGNKASSKAEADMGKIKGSSEKSDAALRKVGTGALVAGTGIMAGLALAVKSAADFEKGLSGIKAVSGATADEMEKVRAKALKIGADTAFSASEGATAIEELVKAGLSVPDVMNGAADATVALAAAGEIDLPEAATIAANAMNQFGLAAGDMPNIADKIAGAANVSAISVSDLGQSMSQVGAVAHLTGLSFDDTSLAITAMGNAGIKGSDAGTSLKSFLMTLQPTTKKASGLMKELGIITKDGANQFYDAAGKIRPMNQMAGVLSKAMKGLSKEQQTAALKTMFGSDAIRAAAIIAGQGAKGMDKLAAGINKTKAADVAATRMDNLAGQIEQAKGSAETLAIQVGSILLPMFTSMMKSVTGLLNWFGGLSNGTKTIIVVILGLVGSLLIAIGVIIKVSQAVRAFRVAMLILNMTFLASPIFWIILAIVALIAIFVLLWKNNKGFRDFFINAWKAIQKAIGSVVGWITGTAVPWLQKAWAAIVSGLQSLWGWVTSIWNSIVAGITWAVNLIKTVVMAVFNAIKAYFTFIFNIYKFIIMTVFNAIKTVITTILTAIQTVITTILNVIVGVWRAVWGFFGPIVMAVWNLIKAVIGLGIAAVMFVIRTYLNMIKAIWTTVWNVIKAVAAAVWNVIKAVIINPLVAIWNKIVSVMNTIKSVMSAAWNAVKSKTSEMWNAIKSAVTTAVGAVMTTISSIKDKIFAVFAGAGTWLWNIGKSIVQGLIDGIGAMIKGVTDKLNFLTNLIPKSKGPASKDKVLLVDNGTMIMNSLISGLLSRVPALESMLGGVTLGMPNMLGSPAVALAASASRTGTPRTELAAPASDAAAGSGDTYSYDIDITNPAPEPASDSIARTMSKIAYLGLDAKGN